MLKPSSLDLSKLDQLKTKVIAFAKDKGPLPLAIAGVALIGIITPFILAATYRHAPIVAELPNQYPSSSESPDSDPSSSPDQPSDDTLKTPAFIDLQPTVDAWLKTTTANVGLMIYDLDNERITASYQANKVFNVASIYKLFFVYDGYLQIETGAIQPNARYATTSDYRASTYTYGECLDLMIRESYNGCADKMRSNQKAFARVEDLIEQLDLKNTTNAGLSSTAADLTELLKLYYEHPDFSDETWEIIADSMLNQPATKIDSETTYNWRQGLPSGFSKQANVYDKVGWAWDADDNIWTTYADAAIVEFPAQNRHYIIVVLTSNLTGRNASTLSNLGSRIEDAIFSSDTNP